MIERDNSDVPLRLQADHLAISRSSLYSRPALPSPEEVRIKILIDDIYTAYPFYGSPRIAVELQRRGASCRLPRARADARSAPWRGREWNPLMLTGMDIAQRAQEILAGCDVADPLYPPLLKRRTSLYNNFAPRSHFECSLTSRLKQLLRLGPRLPARADALYRNFERLGAKIPRVGFAALPTCISKKRFDVTSD